VEITSINGEQVNVIALSKIARQYKMGNNRVYAVLASYGTEPAMIVPFGRGFMRQYRIDELPPKLAEVFEKEKAATREMKKEQAKAMRLSITPASRKKAVVAFKATAAKRQAAELKKLRKLAKAVAALAG